MIRALVFALAFALPAAGQAADGDLDKSFNQTGQVTLPQPSIPGGFLRAADLKIQKDGKILVLGTSQSLSPPQLGDVHLVRLQKTGGLDPSFDGDGVVTTDLGGRAQILREIELQADGKIVAVGLDSAPGSFDNLYDFLVLRYTKSGGLDPSFGEGKGFVLVDLDFVDDLQAVAIQKDKKIVAVGQTYGADGRVHLVILRLLPDGRRDPAFGPLHDGVVTTRVEDVDTLGFGVVIQPDGRIVVAGQSGLIAGGIYDRAPESLETNFFVARFLTDGRPDDDFDDDGVLRLGEPDTFGWAGDVLLQKDGKILVGGNHFTLNGAKGAIAIYRLDTSGERDPTWGKNGLAKIEFTPRPDLGGAMALGPSGKLTVAGTADPIIAVSPAEATTPKMGLARLLANGKLDPTFATKGKKVFPLDPTGCGAQGLALQKDGKIVVGSELTGGGFSRLAVTRHLAKPN